MKPKVGQKISTWFSGQPDGMSTILAVLTYTGKYKEYFDCVLRLTAPNTIKGYAEMAYHSSYYQYDRR